MSFSVKVNGRTEIQVHPESFWNQAVRNIPQNGEFIVYSPDESHQYPRIKVGDGVTVAKDLPWPSVEVANKVAHDLIFGADGEFIYNGSKDVTIPVYQGKINID